MVQQFGLFSIYSLSRFVFFWLNNEVFEDRMIRGLEVLVLVITERRGAIKTGHLLRLVLLQ